MKAKTLIVVLLTAASFSTLNAQDLNKAKLDSLFDLLAANDKAMASLALSKNGKIVYTRAIGYSYMSGNEKTAATEKTIYRIGSITKMFTATMIFQLIEEKKLTLTTPLSKYYPQFPNAEKITIGHMLSHRSGLFSFTSDPSYTTWMTQPATEKELVARMVSHPVDFQPDEKFAYSNTNYLLLGFIIEKITKKSYTENLQKRITSKIGLTSTYYGGKGDPKRGEALSYRYLTAWEATPETDMSVPGGAGALLSTPTELAKFIEALFAGKLVSEESLNQMKTIRDGMGMGMFQVPFNAKRGYGHNGLIDGSASNVFYFPEDGLTLAYCSNGVAYAINDIMISVLSIYFNVPYKLPDFKSQPAVMLTESELESYIGVYSSTQLPLKITISKDNSQLMAQATGQAAFPLHSTGKDKFKFEPAGVVMEFVPDKGELTLKQGGGAFVFKKEK